MIAPLAAALAAAAVLSASAAPPAGAVLFRFADPRITEASGIAAGRASPGVFYVQNDSGDSARFFAVDRRTGATVATVTVTGARNVDWEDIAVGPDAAGTPSVWLADIGDNDAVRRTVQLYRVVEPRLDPRSRDRTLRVPVAEKWRLRYPGGPVDAESLAVAPDGTPYLVTKSFGGATVYGVPRRPRGGARVQTLHQVARISLHTTGTDNPFGLAGQLVATGAAIAADGSSFALRTYADAWVWRVGDEPLGAALRRRPVVVPLPRQQQGEGVAIVGRHLVVDSEGARTPVYSVALPRRRTGPSPGGTCRPPECVVGTATRRPSSGDTGAATWGWWVIGAGALSVATAMVALRTVRKRR